MAPTDFQITRHATAAELRAATHQHLVTHEAWNNHLFGVLGAAAAGGFPGDNLWLSAARDEVVVGCALRTPPWPLSLSYGCDDETASALAAVAASAYDEPFEVNISPHLAAAVARGLEVELDEVSAQGIYRLEVVRTPHGVPGQMRRAAEWDVDMVCQWTLAFQDEVGGGIRRSATELRALVRQWIGSGALVVWDVDDRSVSMASARGPTPNGVRISLVYTPPEHRAKGYASACVAALTQRELDAGRKFCFLFTDLSNATSNRIYRAVGYEMVGTLAQYRRR